MASHDSEKKTHEAPVQFLDWPYHLPVLNPSDQWIEAEDNLLQKYTPTAFLVKWGISLETYQNISKDLKNPKTRAVARASYRGECLVAAFKVVMQINRKTFDPRVRMSTPWLAYACEETADMDDDTFEAWARRQGTQEKFKNIANELRKARRACPDILHHSEQKNDLSAEQESLIEDLANHRNDEEHSNSDDRARAPSPSPSDTGSAGSWTILKDDEAHSDDELCIFEADLTVDAPAGGPEELEHLESDNEQSTSQNLSHDDSRSPNIEFKTSMPSTDASGLFDDVKPQQFLDVQQEIEVRANVRRIEIDGLQTERELLQMQINTLEHAKFDLECSKEQLQGLNEEREIQLNSCYAEIKVLRSRMEELETKVNKLNTELTRSRNQGAIWQQHHNVMTKYLFEADALNAESMAKQDQLKFSNQEISKDRTLLREGMEHMWQDYLTIKSDMNNEQLELQKTADCLLEENEMLQLRCQTFEEAFHHAVVKQSKEDLELLNREMNRRYESDEIRVTESKLRCRELENNCERANADVESLKSKNKLLSETLAATQAEYAEAKLQLDSAESESHADIVAIAGEHAELEYEKARLNEEVERLEKGLADAQREREELLTENEALENEYEALGDEMSAVEENCEILEAENQNLGIENEKLKDHIHGLETKNGDLKDDVLAVQAGQNTLEAQNEALIAENEELKVDKVNFVGELTAVQEDLSAVRKELSTAQEELSATSTGWRSLEAQNATLVAEREELKAEKMNLEGELTSVQEQGEELSLGYAALQDDHKELKTVTQDLRAENIGLKRSKHTLKGNMEHVMAMKASVCRQNDRFMEKVQALESKIDEMKDTSTRFKSANMNLNASNKEMKAEIDNLKAESRDHKTGKEFFQKSFEEGMGYFSELEKDSGSTISDLKELLAREKEKREELEKEKAANEEKERIVTKLVEGLHADHGRLIDKLEVALHARLDAEDKVKSLVEDNGVLSQKMLVLQWKNEAACDKLNVFKKFLPPTADMKATDLEKFMTESVAYE